MFRSFCVNYTYKQIFGDIPCVKLLYFNVNFFTRNVTKTVATNRKPPKYPLNNRNSTYVNRLICLKIQIKKFIKRSTTVVYFRFADLYSTKIRSKKYASKPCQTNYRQEFYRVFILCGTSQVFIHQNNRNFMSHILML